MGPRRAGSVSAALTGARVPLEVAGVTVELARREVLPCPPLRGDEVVGAVGWPTTAFPPAPLVRADGVDGEGDDETVLKYWMYFWASSLE